MYLLVKQLLFLYVTFYIIIDTHFLHIRTNVMVNKSHNYDIKSHNYYFMS